MDKLAKNSWFTQLDADVIWQWLSKYSVKRTGGGGSWQGTRVRSNRNADLKGRRPPSFWFKELASLVPLPFSFLAKPPCSIRLQGVQYRSYFIYHFVFPLKIFQIFLSPPIYTQIFLFYHPTLIKINSNRITYTQQRESLISNFFSAGVHAVAGSFN